MYKVATSTKLNCVGAALLLLIAGCQTGSPARLKSELSDIPEMLTHQKRTELLADLERFVEYFESKIADTAGRIEVETDDRDVRRAALKWKLKLIPEAQDFLSSDDPLPLLFDAWAFCVRMTQYLQQGDGRTLFGAHQPLAVSAAAGLQARIEEIARQYIADDKLPRLIGEIESYARENPIRGVFAYEAPRPFTDAEQGRNVITRVLGAPMRAAERVTEGLDPTLRLSQSVDRFTELMEHYPALIRWQTQLLLLQLDESPAIRSIVRGVENMSEASVDFAAIADELPERLRVESQQLLKDFDSRQPELRSTLGEAQETVAAVDRALERAEGVSASIECALAEASRAGEVWQHTAEAVTQTMKQIQQFGERNGEDPTGTGAGNESDLSTATADPAAGSVRQAVPVTQAPAQPGESKFDINDYTQTAEAITTATQELRSLLGEVRDFLDGGTTDRSLERVDALADSTLDQTRLQARGVIDHATWRGVQLVTLVFALFAIYRLVFARYTPGRASK